MAKSIATCASLSLLAVGGNAFVQRNALVGGTVQQRFQYLELQQSTVVNNDEEINTRSSDKEVKERARKAKQTWSTVALQDTEDKSAILPVDDITTIYNQRLFDDFMATKGTYYVNGLGNCQIGDRLCHPFEAHGFVKSLSFDGKGNLVYTSRIVETPLTVKERQNNQMEARGVMSTVADFGTLQGTIKNAISPSERDTANLVANLWPPSSDNQDEIDPVLITCTDNGEPYALDPKTLNTKGRLVDVIPKLKEVFPSGTDFIAHARYDDDRERFVMCVSKMDIPGENFMGNTTVRFVEFDTNFDVVTERHHSTRFMVFHDWVLTQNYYVVPENPAYLKWPDIGKFMFGQTVGTDVFAMEEETNGAFLLIPRHDSNEPVRRVESDAFFNLFHFGASFESDDNNEMIINGCVFDYYTFGGEMGFDGPTQKFDPISWGSIGGKTPPPRLDQFIIDLETFELKTKQRIPVVPVDMPVFNGDAKPLKYTYFLGCSRPEGWFPFRSIVKLNLETFEYDNWDAGDGCVTSEPMYIPRQDAKSEDDGFVISIVHDSETLLSKLMIWDSMTFANGPIAEMKLDSLIPWCVHGSYIPAFYPFED